MGRAYVEILGDLSGLRAAEQEAQAIAARIGQLNPAVSFGGGNGGGGAVSGASPSFGTGGAGGNSPSFGTAGMFGGTFGAGGQPSGPFVQGVGGFVGAKAAERGAVSGSQLDEILANVNPANIAGIKISGAPMAAALSGQAQVAPAVAGFTSNLGIGTGSTGFGSGQYSQAHAGRDAGIPFVPESVEYASRRQFNEIRGRDVAAGGPSNRAALADRVEEKIDDAVEEALTVAAQGSAGGGRTGGGGGRGGSGSRGGMYGLRGWTAGQLGVSIAAIFAAEAVTDLAVGFGEADYIQNHPGRFLREYDQPGALFQGAANPTIQRLAREEANISAKERRYQAGADFPVLGMIPRLMNWAVDYTQDLADQKYQVQRAKGSEAVQEEARYAAMGRIDVATGDPVNAMRTRANRETASAAHENPALAAIVRRANDLEITNADLGIDLGTSSALAGSYAARFAGRRDSLQAYDFSRAGARSALQASLIGQPPDLSQARITEFDDQTSAGRARLVASQSAANIGNESSARALGYIAGHDDPAAQLAVLRGQRQQANLTQDVATRESALARIDAEEHALAVSVLDQRQIASGTAADAVSSAGLRRDRLFAGANIVERFGQGLQAHIGAIHDPTQAYAATVQAQAELGDALLTDKRRLTDDSASLSVRTYAAQLRRDEYTRAPRVAEQIGGIEAERRHIDPRLRGEFDRTALAELEETRHRELDFHSGGYAVRGNRFFTPVDPIVQARMAREDKVIKSDIDEENRNLRADQKGFDEKGGAAGASAAMAKDVNEILKALTDLARKFQPYAMAH